ncbi:hypothetical protein PENSPDRAFT_671821 [Peniophora sp. CONT]|nr:hypothetical protein PENSPDRAFT_671821 [Peniophora sp. CONT]
MPTRTPGIPARTGRVIRASAREHGAYAASITYLRTTMSSTSPDQLPPFILKLPTELFCLVVEHVAERERPCPPASADEEEAEIGSKALCQPWNLVAQGGSLGWIKLTHVCRNWRVTICEGMPLLWGQYIGCLPAACEEMLRRAGDNVPLDVQFGCNHSTLHTLVRNVPELISGQQFTRIRSFHFIDVRDCGVQLPFVPSNLHKMSSLETIEVHYLGLDYECFDDDVFLQPEPCVMQSSRLRVARFTNYFIPWTSRSLVRLYLAFDDFGLPFDTLHDTLSRVADTIEVLELDMAIPMAIKRRTPIPHALPKLRSLIVREQGELLVAFLQQITFPCTTILHVMDVLYGDDWAAASMALVRNAYSQLGSGFTCTTLSVTDARAQTTFHNINRGLQLGFSGSDLPLRSTNPHNSNLVLGFEYNPAGHQTALPIMLDELLTLDNCPWKTVTHLNVDLQVWRFWNEVTQVLSFLPHIRQLRLVDPLCGESDFLSDKNIPFPNIHASASTATAHLEHLCIVQHANSDILPLFDLCETLQSRLQNVSNNLPVASLRLEIIEKSGPLPSDAEEQITTMFTRVADRFELHLQHLPAQENPNAHSNPSSHASSSSV